MRAISSLLIIGLLASLIMTGSCSNPLENKPKKDSPYISITGNLKGALGKKAAGGIASADSILAIPLAAGLYNPDWGGAPGALINTTDGTFKIQLDKTIKVWNGTTAVDTPTDWVLLLLDSHAATRYDQVVGFLSLRELDQSLIQFPTSKIKKDSIAMGKISQSGDEAQSDTAVHNDTAVFNLTIQQLREMAHMGKTLKMIKNSYGMYTPPSATKTDPFDVRATYQLGAADLSKLASHQMIPAEYLDTNKINYELRVIPGGRPEFDFNQIVARTISFDLYPPSQTSVENVDGSGNVYTAPLNSCFSTDTSFNPNIQKDTAGNMAKVNVYLLEAGGAHPSISYPGFKGISPDGTWQLRENRSSVIARFDLGLGNPIDSATGKPAIYVPSLEVSVNADSTISAITAHWYYWDPATHAYVQETDDALLQNSISSASLQITGWPSNNSDNQNFGVSIYGEHFSQPVTSALVLTPARKWIYAQPSVPGQKVSIGVSYTCFYQTFLVRMDAWSAR